MQVLEIPALTPEWHERRRTSISGTDVVALMLGKHFDKTPLSIWARITGKVAPAELTGKHLEWGQRSETLNRDWLEDELACLITEGPGLVAHDDYPWMVGTPDGFINQIDEPQRGVWEAKAPTVYTPQDWTERVPDAPQIQAQTYMAITGCSWAVCSAILIEPGAMCPELYHGRLDTDNAFQETMMDRVTRFWEQNIQRDIRPEPCDADADTKVLNALWRERQEAVTAELPAHLVDGAWERDACQAEIKALKLRIDKIKNDVKSELLNRDATIGTDQEGNVLWRWTQVPGGPVAASMRKDSMRLNRSKYHPE